MKARILIPILVFLTLLTPRLDARVKLVALPERARVVLSLAHPNATLVEEERLITLQNGVNQVDFAWKGVQIDPSSIQVRALDNPDKVLVLNTSYPPNEDALVWEISSDAPRAERLRISYLLAHFHRDVVYKAVAEPNESSLTLRNYLRLRNNSGEDFEQAQISIGYGDPFRKDIEHEEVLEMLSERIEQVPVRKVLTWDAAQQPWDPEYAKDTVGIPLNYIIQNDQASKLGQHTLLPGKTRIFIKTRELPAEAGAPEGEGVTFTGEDIADLTPVDRELKLFIGQSRDVKVTQRKVKDEQINIRRNNRNQVVLHDQNEEYRLEIENFKKGPVQLVIVEHVPGYWKMVANSHAAQFERKDAFTFEYTLTLPPESNQDKKTVVTFNLHRLNVQGNEPASF